MNQNEAPLLDGLADYHRQNRYGFTPPGHRQGPRPPGRPRRTQIGDRRTDVCRCPLRWVQPRWDAELHLAYPPSPEQVAQVWNDHPDAAGALIASPTAYGTCADLEGIASVCHERGKALIGDEAWGARLPFHEDLPTWAMNASADVCVVGVHKMGAEFEQGSVFHVKGDLVDVGHLSTCADLLMTTSPNVLIYSAIDGWRRHMVASGRELLGQTLELGKPSDKR